LIRVSAKQAEERESQMTETTQPAPQPPQPTEVTDIEREVQALLQEAVQQRERFGRVRQELRDKLAAFAVSEGGEMIGASPLVVALNTILDELHDTQLLFTQDLLRLMRKAVTPEDEGEEGEDEGEEGEDDDLMSVLYDEDAADVISVLDQYRVLLENTISTATGEAQRQLKLAHLKCVQALDLVRSISVLTSEEDNDGQPAEPSN